MSLLVLGGGASSQHPPSTQAARAIQPNSVALVSARTEHVIRSASFKSTPSDVVFGRRSAWILLRDQPLVNRVDPATGRITGHVPLPFVPSRMVADGDSAWVTEESGPHIAEVGTRRGSRVGVRKVLSVPTAGPRLSSPAGIAVGAGSLWVARGAHIARVDPRTGRVLKLFPAPVTSNWVVFAGGKRLGGQRRQRPGHQDRSGIGIDHATKPSWVDQRPRRRRRLRLGPGRAVGRRLQAERRRPERPGTGCVRRRSRVRVGRRRGRLGREHDSRSDHAYRHRHGRTTCGDDARPHR